MYKWFLAIRYLHTKLIAFFGIASVTLCVAMVLVVVSVMGGFLDTIRARARGLHSEIVVDCRSLQGFPYYEEFGEHVLRELPDVARVATPAIYSYGIVRVPANKYTKMTRILGVRLDDYVKVNGFSKGLHYNHYYPGSTHLGLNRLPVAGVTADGQIRLPGDLEEANAQWREWAAREAPKELAEFEARPFAACGYPGVIHSGRGERVYAARYEEPAYLDAPFPGAIVGADVLFERLPDGKFDRYLARGAMLSLTTQALSPAGTLTGEPPINIPVRYVDDSRTGIFEIDSTSVYVDFEMLQHRLAMDPQPLVEGGMTRPRTTQLLVGLQPGVELNSARRRISTAWVDFRSTLDPDELTVDDAHALSFVEVYTWEDLQREFIAAVEKEKWLVTILFGLISGVAIVLIGCIFYMIVEKKTKDIGILKSLGASSSGVGGLFVLYAAAVGVTGAILGTVLGSVFVWYINDIQDFLASLDPALRIWSPAIYSFDRIPEVVKQSDALWIGVAAVLSSVAGSVLPAILAARVWPVEALRYE